MSERDIKLLLEDMILSCEKIKKYVSDFYFESFLSDDKTIDAVVRNLEIIGEAANRIPQDFKSKYHYVEWKRMRGLRNRIVHDYFGIDYEIVWNIIQNDLENLIEQIQDVKDNII